jgi:hypothetical protein
VEVNASLSSPATRSPKAKFPTEVIPVAV